MGGRFRLVYYYIPSTNIARIVDMGHTNEPRNFDQENKINTL